MSEDTNVEVQVQCASCGGVFPCEVYASDEEAEEAKGLARTGATRTMRVARYCLHCGKTVMVELTLAPGEAGREPLPLGLDERFGSTLPREGDPPIGGTR